MSKNSKKLLYIIIILALLLVNGVGVYFLFKSNEENQDLTTEINEVRDEYTLLQADLNTQLAQLESMKGKNADLDSIIAIRETEILAQQEEITKWKNQSSYNASQLKDAKAQIVTLLNEKEIFKTQLDSLFVANKELKEVQAQLEITLQDEMEYSSELEDANEYLDEKFELGSLLQADELTITALKIKDNGAEKEVAKAKNTEKLMVCYQTGENIVRESGTVSMQLRIISPAGETLYIESEGSGTFTNKENGEAIRYTKLASFEYDNTNKKICIYWSHDVNQEGVYQAEIYQDGYLVGYSSIELK